MKTIFQFLKEIHQICQFCSVETPTRDGRVHHPSNSELRRWIEQGSLLINNEKCKPDEILDFPLISVVLFPKSGVKRITTL